MKLNQLGSLIADMQGVKTDISWLKKAIIGLYGTIGAVTLTQIVKAFVATR